MSPFKRKGASGKKQNRKDEQTKTRIKDLEYYLGKEWVDFKPTTADSMVNYYRNLSTSSYQPKKCPACKKYWVNTITERGKLIPRELDKHYYNIPTEKEKCWEC